MSAPVAAVNRTTDGLAGTADGNFTTFHGFQYGAGATGGLIEIRDGSATGTILGRDKVAANAAGNLFFIERGIQTANGVWVEFTGTADGTVTVYGR